MSSNENSDKPFDVFAELARDARRLSRVMEPFTPNPRSKLSEEEQYYSFYTGDVDTTIIDGEEEEQEEANIAKKTAAIEEALTDE